MAIHIPTLTVQGQSGLPLIIKEILDMTQFVLNLVREPHAELSKAVAGPFPVGGGVDGGPGCLDGGMYSTLPSSS